MSLKIDKDEIKTLIKDIVDKLGLQIYEITTQKIEKNDVLRILLENKDEEKGISFDLIVLANEKISEALDSLKTLQEHYYLDVASVGIEKPIKSKDKLIKAVGKYLYIESDLYSISTNATLNDYKDDKFYFEYLLKGQKKKINLEYEEIDFVRFAVKF